ncbi:ABC transporter ATP-binding protein/permease, partial [Candidatus Woesearchaeota archaeon]|nr:ABC transporter ATP-binding protein/permease [Candidatus Woesearchaeota archaeon]
MKNLYKTQTFLHDYWSLLRGSRLRFSVMTALKALSTAGGFVIAYLLGHIVDFFVNYNQQPLTGFYLAVAGIASIGAFQVWMRFFAKFRLQALAGDIRKNTRISAMNKLMDLPLKWHEKEETGSKIEKINSGSEAIYTGIHLFSNEGIDILVGLVGAIGIFAALDWRYALFGLGYALVYVFGELYFNKRLTALRTETAKIKEKVSGKLHESSSNLLTVKSMGLKKVFTKSTEEYEEKYYRTWLRAKKFGQFKVKTIKTFAAVGYALFVLMVGFDALSASITVGSIYVYSSYFNRLKAALESITDRSIEYIDVKTKLGRFMTILGREYLDERDKGFPKDWKTIQFSDVSFKYKDKDVL